MRYLKRFNEAIGDKKDLLLDFDGLTKDCLAYLIDAGFTPSVDYHSPSNPNYGVDFYLFKGDNPRVRRYSRKIFKWEDIKDDFIPFLELVKQRFIILNEYGKAIYIRTTDGNYTLTIKDILDDNVGLIVDSEIKGIEFELRGYKFRI